MDILVFLQVIVLSLVPVFEGRYALVTGIIRGLDPITSFVAASIGVLVLSVTLPRVLGYIDDILVSERARLLQVVSHAYSRYVVRTRKRIKPYIERYGELGLLVFVALPLPGTGIWTGGLAAALLGISMSRTMPVLILGGLLSNIITLSLALLNIHLFF